MSMQPIIARRFRGPPASGNGGYSSGLAASFIDGPAEITLRTPPPLDTLLTVEQDDDGVRLFHDGILTLEAHSRELALDLPEPLSLEEARAAELEPADLRDHVFPGCFVCGPERAHGDGLRIFSGPTQERPGTFAATWTPDDSLADNDGAVRAEFLWSALDCPSGWAAFGGAPAGTPMLLGRLAGMLERTIPVGAPVVSMSWSIGADGRKHHAASALFTADGQPIARARATWIALR